MSATAYGSPAGTKSATANAALAGLNRPATVRELSEASGLTEEFIRKHFRYHASRGFPDGTFPFRGQNAAGDEIFAPPLSAQVQQLLAELRDLPDGDFSLLLQMIRVYRESMLLKPGG